MFNSEQSYPTAPYTARIDALNEPHVEDRGGEGTTKLTGSSSGAFHTLPDSSASGDTTQAMIVWGSRTEPDIVVDRLLSSWTTLTGEQIHRSICQDDGTWRKSFHKSIEEAKVDKTDFSDWEEEYSLDSGANQELQDDEQESVNEPAAHSTDRRSDAAEIRTSVDAAESSAPPRRQHNETRREHRRSKGKERHHTETHRHPSHHAPSENEQGTPQYAAAHESNPAHIPKHIPRKSERKKAYKGNLRPIPPSDPTTYPGFPIPFVPNPPLDQHTMNPNWPNVPPEQQPPPTHPAGYAWPIFASPIGNIAGATVPPKFTPVEAEHLGPSIVPGQSVPQSFNDNPFRQHPAVPRSKEKEETILAAVAELIEKGGNQHKVTSDDPRFAKVLQLLVTQQEQQVQSELDRARAVAEVEMKHLLDARDKDDASIRRLEKLIMQQREEQQKAEAVWRAERIALEERAAMQAQEAKEQVEREINAAHSAKKASKKALKFAQAEAEKRAQEKAEEHAKKEREKADKKAKKRIDHYEKLLEAMATKQSQAQTNGEHPVRRTIMANGHHSIEVSEYGSIGSTFPATAYIREELFPPNPNERDDRTRVLFDQRSGHKLHTSAAALQPSWWSPTRTSMRIPGVEQQTQQMILFPAKLDRASAKISELQLSLAKYGVNARFQDSELDGLDEVSHHNSGNEIVRSSVFWEAPCYGFGSELLATYRRLGWRPPYARSSGEVFL